MVVDLNRKAGLRYEREPYGLMAEYASKVVVEVEEGKEGYVEIKKEKRKIW